MIVYVVKNIINYNDGNIIQQYEIIRNAVENVLKNSVLHSNSNSKAGNAFHPERGKCDCEC